MIIESKEYLRLMIGLKVTCHFLSQLHLWGQNVTSSLYVSYGNLFQTSVVIGRLDCPLLID